MRADLQGFFYEMEREWMGVEPTATRNATRHRF